MISDERDRPDVDVVMPIRDEAADLEAAVESVLAERYPGNLRLCLAVAPSSDGTEDIAERLARTHPEVAVVANPAGSTPAGLNAAIAATRAPVVVRVDGHAVLRPAYVERAVETLLRTGAVNVGGRQVPEPTTDFERAVADATTSVLGTGGAQYRVGGSAGAVDTVYLGVFDRAAGDAVGWFDETLIRNQDYELNLRLRRNGGTVWFEPDLEVGYRPRSTAKALGRQYYEYGWWKSVVIRRFPDSLRLRQLAPAALPVALAGAIVFARWRRSAAAVPTAYAALCLAEGVRQRRSLRPALAIARALAVMHLSWGAGFWAGMVAAVRRRAAGRAG